MHAVLSSVATNRPIFSNFQTFSAFVYFETGSHYVSPGWTEGLYVDQIVLDLTEIHLRLLGLKI